MISIRTILKALVSIGLLGYLIYIADPVKILHVLGTLWHEGGLIYIGLATILFLLSIVALSFRWQILVSGYGFKIPTRSLFKYYLIGLFFNNFLPTGIGGDVLRIYNLIRDSNDRTMSFASVITERLLGITSTLILSIISLIVLHDKMKTDILLIIVFGMFLMVIFFFFLAFHKGFVQPIDNICTRFTVFRIGERTQKFLNAIRFYSGSKIIFIKILFVSFISQILIITMTYFLAMALNIEVTYDYMFLVVPIAFILTMLPSINGIGFRDGGYVILLAKIGISKAAALSLSFLTLIIPMVISISGGIFFMLQKRAIRDEEVKIVEKSI